MQFHEEHYASRFSKYGYGYKPQELGTIDLTDFKATPKALKKYVDRIAFELSEQVDVQHFPLIAVASYVDLDDSLKNSQALGNKIAETLVISLSEIGFKIIELNLTDSIKINENGNFIFDRNITSKLSAPFVLSGIINYTKTGVHINSRLMQTKNAEIFASNSLFMPNMVVKNTFPIVDGSDLIIKAN